MDTGSHEVAPTALEVAPGVAKEPTPCPSCGYDVTGVTGDRCPECGYIIGNGGMGDPARYEPFLERAEAQVLVSILILGAVSLIGCLWTRGLLLILLAPFYVALLLGLAAKQRNHGRWRGAAYILWWRLMWPLLMPCVLLAAGALASVVQSAAYTGRWEGIISFVLTCGSYIIGMWVCLRRVILWATDWRRLAERAGLPPIVGSSERSARSAAWIVASIAILAATIPLGLVVAFALGGP